MNNGKKQAWRNVGLNLSVKMELRNNFGHAYGHKEKNWELQHPQRLKPSFWAQIIVILTSQSTIYNIIMNSRLFFSTKGVQTNLKKQT